MIRKTLTILSLLGLLVSAGLWGVSYLRIVYQCNTHRYTTRWVILANGALYDEGYGFSGRNSIAAPWVQLPKLSVPLKSSNGNLVVLKNGQWKVLGFAGMKTIWKPAVRPRMRIPFWIPTTFFASSFCVSFLLPLHRRRKRKKLGLCVTCGYDLRGSEVRCPECNTSFEQSQC